MNRLRSHKFKPNAGDVGANNNNNTQASSPLVGNGLLNKLTKRYSTLSNKITRRQAGCKGGSPQKVLSGSYDMTGANSEDHRLEIGAPILISTTTLDTDRLDVSEARLRQIGGGIAGSSSLVRTAAATATATTTTTTAPDTAQSSPQIPSSGSENDMFVDALCTTPMGEESEREPEEERFVLAQQTPKRPATPRARGRSPESASERESQDSERTPVNRNIEHSQRLSNYYETPKAQPRNKQKLALRQHSKSFQNLHRSELKVFLQKAPSMELDMSLTTADLEHCRDLPKLPELYGASKCSLAASTAGEEDDADKENSSPSVVGGPSMLSKSAPNTPMCPEQKVSGYLAQHQQLQLQQQQHRFQSVDSLNIHGQGRRRKSVVFSSSSSNSINQHLPASQLGHRRGSKSSVALADTSSSVEDFDLKSVSCQSLNAQNLFLSIDELNEITRQINESEEFNREIDLEYCTHRDNLKPSERRITLLKNKNSTRLISFNHNKEKLKKGWSGVKHWLGEEGSRLKEVVQKQAALQRVGASTSRLNLSLAENRGSPSAARGAGSRADRSLCEADQSQLSTSLAQQSAEGAPDSPGQELGVSCSNIAEGDAELGEEREGAEDTADDLESSFTQRPGDDSSPASKRARREGQNGFEELRRYIKQGGDFGKELILILQERVESELLYSKSLSKMANKLNKACRELPGSIAEAWRGVATEMESRSDIHRQLSASLTEDIVKPLKSIVEGHHKTRKSVESNVDKASRVLAEWRASEAKAKKASHTAARENEKLQDAMLDVRIQKSPSIALLHQTAAAGGAGGASKSAAVEKEMKSAEKDCAKLDNKRKKAEEAVKRADVEYYTLCVRAERARVDWEMAVLRGSSLLQNVESQRLGSMKSFVTNYVRLTANMNPILEGLVQRLEPQVEACNVQKDLQVVKNIRRISEGPSEQLLPDFYCEHTTLAMNRERRKHALVKLLQLVKTDLERERRSRNGLKGLSQSLNNQEHQNITDKLYHIRSMLTYLEGARLKLHSALLELDHKPRTSHPLAQHIQITRDRTGLQQSILKVPLWLKNNDKMNTSGNLGGGSNNDSLRENDYECISQANTSANISCAELSHKDLVLSAVAATKPFSRSKSNIETFSTNTQICLSAAADKTKTIATGLEADPYSDRGQADGGSNQHDSDFDEFSSQDDDDDDDAGNEPSRKEHKASVEKGLLNGSVGSKLNGDNNHHHHLHQHQNPNHYYQNSAEIAEKGATNQSAPDGVVASNGTSVVLSRCKALYSYTPKLYDELELSPGDIIEVHAKQEDGWWLGALRNQVGIFPATYVEEFA